MSAENLRPPLPPFPNILNLPTPMVYEGIGQIGLAFFSNRTFMVERKTNEIIYCHCGVHLLEIEPKFVLLYRTNGKLDLEHMHQKVTEAVGNTLCCA